MLSRVGESLYWTARYLERAEDLTRILDVNFLAQLDRDVAARRLSWQQLVTSLGDEAAYAEHYDDHTAETVTDWVLWHRDNPNAVSNCIELARENARSVREQISVEMWSAINRLFLIMRGPARRGMAYSGPHAFFEQVRNSTHLFGGAADATMDHGEAYEFILLGKHLERAEKTARVVGGRYVEAADASPDDPRRPRMLVDLLLSCSAFEAYVRRYGTALEPLAVAEELIRSKDSPRSVQYSLARCLAAVEAIESENRIAHRILGRLVAEVEFGELPDPSGRAVAAAMSNLLNGINSVGEAIVRAYFSSRALAVAALAEQETQQQ